ncbi:hypothetical protein CERZMDRAFT_38037 [Cercospora zeae-maydis SCOH1-5]|uniref:Threonyl/alanyl tRNA synthetase SAD domain-containing protein n=1 Tax=Cercospora zeae-maydis SCOH1-5 TaxID=717836 RepID=A0A6A6FKK0_9PEZI|nr:hypothetical protein CERZMDRAFT_38037 [Cercospora zeae-maydis SCOH1-5]
MNPPRNSSIDESARTHLTRLRALRHYKDLSDDERNLFKAVTASKDDTNRCYIVETTETIFYVQGGCQPCDTGVMTINGAKLHVTSVRCDSRGAVLHLAYANGEIEQPNKGDLVEQQIDGEKRDLHSRSHTAGHIIGLAVRQLAAKHQLDITELKASHYPDACFVEFKGLLDGKHKDEIQSQAIEFVQQALPVKLYWYRPEELTSNNVITAKGMPIVTGADGTCRVVDIVGAGAYPCGGTHVPDTSFVGKIAVRTIKRQKGNTKVSYAVVTPS